MFNIQMTSKMNVGINKQTPLFSFYSVAGLRSDAIIATMELDKNKNLVCISIAEVLSPARRHQEPKIASVFSSEDNNRQQYQMQALKL